MSNSTKTTQLQIRISPAEKSAIQRAAQQMNMDMSTYVLDKLLPQRARELQDLLDELVFTNDPSFVLSEINTFLSRLNNCELKNALSITLPVDLSNYLRNYLAAMVEFVCNQQRLMAPEWIKTIKPLSKPVFGSTLQNLRLYLLTNSPAPFRRRNIFVDTTIGGQV